MLGKIAIPFIIASLVMTAVNADAALQAYLYLKGQKVGTVRGSVTQKGRENSIAVIAFEQTSKMESSAKGTVGGPLKVGQVILTKEVDMSSPVLRQMLNSQEPGDAVIRFFTPQKTAAAGVGVEYQHYTVTLTNARVVSLKTVMPNVRNPEEVRYTEYEVIGLTYDNATWTWMNGGISAVESGGYFPQ